MKKKTLLGCAVSLGISLVVTFLVLLAMGGLASGITTQERVKCLSNAFFTVGSLMFGFSVLLWASGEGAFDLLTYSITLLFRLKTVYERESYTEYKERKRGKATNFYLVLMIPGAILLLVAVFFAVYFEYV
jgi:hypothetical protein